MKLESLIKYANGNMRTPLIHNILKLSAFIGFLLLTGCHRNQNIKESEPVNLKLTRFEDELFNLDIYSVNDTLDYLKERHAGFLPLFSNKIIEIGDINNEWIGDALTQFITDQAVYNIYERVDAVFSDFSEITKQLEQCFGNYHTMFPNRELPEIYTYVSGFNQSIVVAPDIVGVSLEKYLGPDEKLYNNLYPPLPKFQRKLMYPGKIPSDVLWAWISSEFEYQPEQNNLVSKLIFEGRLIYITKMLMPNTHDSIVWGFNERELQFCKDNEKQMFKYLIEQKLLFETNTFRINQFTEPAPFTKDFSKDSPGRAAIWLGYRIIEKYIKNNKNITIEQLMSENDYHKILNNSRYNPD